MLVRWELSSEKGPGKVKEEVKCQHGTVNAPFVCSKAVRDKARMGSGQEVPARVNTWSPWAGLKMVL